MHLQPVCQRCFVSSKKRRDACTTQATSSQHKPGPACTGFTADLQHWDASRGGALSVTS